jgi:predicted HTH domain antitoxin
MKLTDLINEEKYTIIDPKGNPAGTGTKMQANQRQKKLGGSKKGYFVVPAKKALKARRTLEKYKFDFKSTKLQDLMSDLYFEGVNEVVNEAMKPSIKMVNKFEPKEGIQIMAVKTLDDKTHFGGMVQRGRFSRIIPFLPNQSKSEVQKRALQIYDELGKDESVNEGASTEEKRIVMMAVKKIAKYRNVPLDYAVGDVMRAAQELERDIKKGKVK